MSLKVIYVFMLCLTSSLHARNLGLVRKSSITYPSSNPTNTPSPSLHPATTADFVYSVLQRTANHRWGILYTRPDPILNGSLIKSLCIIISWEWGTQCEVILERYYPSLSVYSTTKRIPLNPDNIGDYPQKLFDVIDPILQRRAPGAGPIIQDDAAGDPASLLPGVVVLGAASRRDPRGRSQKDYNAIAEEQVKFLLEKVPRASNGAISHRVKEVQLW